MSVNPCDVSLEDEEMFRTKKRSHFKRLFAAFRILTTVLLLGFLELSGLAQPNTTVLNQIEVQGVGSGRKLLSNCNNC